MFGSHTRREREGGISGKTFLPFPSTCHQSGGRERERCLCVACLHLDRTIKFLPFFPSLDRGLLLQQRRVLLVLVLDAAVLVAAGVLHDGVVVGLGDGVAVGVAVARAAHAQLLHWAEALLRGVAGEGRAGGGAAARHGSHGGGGAAGGRGGAVRRLGRRGAVLQHRGRQARAVVPRAWKLTGKEESD